MYITAHGAQALRKYQFVGEDRSKLYKYVLSPLAEFCVRQTPEWLAPNTITLIGFIVQLSALVAVAIYCPNLTEVPPQWVCLFGALCMFIYSTMDNMDGKQARRTGASSPLGLLFDHGCDALNAGFVGPLIANRVFGADPNAWHILGLWSTTTIPFFLNTWEQYHLKKFILPIINGPSEGLVLAIITMIVAGVYGPEVYSQPCTVLPGFMTALYTPVVRMLRTLDIPGKTDVNAPLSYFDVLMMTSGCIMTVTVLMNTLNVVVHIMSQKDKRPIHAIRALGHQVPTWILSLFATAWVGLPACRSAVQAHPYMWTITSGCIFADLTAKLMVAHTCDQKYRPNYSALIAYGVAPVFEYFRQFSSDSGEALVSPTVMLYASYLVAAASLSHFFFFAVRELARILEIDVFDSTKQRMRARKQ